MGSTADLGAVSCTPLAKMHISTIAISTSRERADKKKRRDLVPYSERCVLNTVHVNVSYPSPTRQPSTDSRHTPASEAHQDPRIILPKSHSTNRSSGLPTGRPNRRIDYAPIIHPGTDLAKAHKAFQRNLTTRTMRPPLRTCKSHKTCRYAASRLFHPSLSEA